MIKKIEKKMEKKKRTEDFTTEQKSLRKKKSNETLKWKVQSPKLKLNPWVYEQYTVQERIGELKNRSTGNMQILKCKGKQEWGGTKICRLYWKSVMCVI